MIATILQVTTQVTCTVPGTQYNPFWASLGYYAHASMDSRTLVSTHESSQYVLDILMACHETLSPGSNQPTLPRQWRHEGRQAGCPGGKAALCQRWKRSITNNATAAAVERGKEKYHSVRAAFVIIPLLVSDWLPPRTISRGVASQQDCGQTTNCYMGWMTVCLPSFALV